MAGVRANDEEVVLGWTLGRQIDVSYSDEERGRHGIGQPAVCG